MIPRDPSDGPSCDGNFFAGLAPSRDAETCDQILHHEQLKIERIVSLGQASAEGFWYQQETHEWVMVLRGGAGLELEGGEIVAMGPGDYVDIPAHRRHRVAWTADDEPTVWLAVHY